MLTQEKVTRKSRHTLQNSEQGLQQPVFFVSKAEVVCPCSYQYGHDNTPSQQKAINPHASQAENCAPLQTEEAPASPVCSKYQPKISRCEVNSPCGALASRSRARPKKRDSTPSRVRADVGYTLAPMLSAQPVARSRGTCAAQRMAYSQILPKCVLMSFALSRHMRGKNKGFFTILALVCLITLSRHLHDTHKKRVHINSFPSAL